MTHYRHTCADYFSFSFGLLFYLISCCLWLLVFYLMPHFFWDFQIPIPSFVKDMHQWLYDHYLLDKWPRHAILFLMFFIVALLCSAISHYFSEKLEARSL